MKLIDKDALVAEIEKRINAIEKIKLNDIAGRDELIYIKGFINTLEVKEVDLEKELIKWHKEHFKKDGTFIGMSGFYLTNNSQIDIAKHFFELGMAASNPLTWEDVRDIYDLAYNLRFPHKKQKEFFKELLKRFKAEKGE